MVINTASKKETAFTIDVDNATVCVVGLGYVGFPLVEAFGKSLKVIGYDVKKKSIVEFKRDNKNANITFTDNAADIAAADFIIICVPTPVTNSKEPDMSFVESAAATAGRNMKKNCIVVLESTVYPGTTEEIVKPILEKESGMVCGVDFKIAYSPERVNPGDNAHTIDKITKIISGMDRETTDLMDALYSKITNTYRAKDIQTAEAAKVIENIQRDLNIALMNELSLIFEKLGLSTREVLDAAATKWNFIRYSPGLVGGHCIPVDPYYLVHRAQAFGYHPQVILAGRSINDSMAKHVAEMTIKALNDAGKVIKDSRVLVMGLTYKENVPDVRETPVKQMIKELREYHVDVYGYDPLLDNAEEEFGVKTLNSLDDAVNFDAVILAVPHDVFKEADGKISLKTLATSMNSRPVLIDIKRCFDPDELAEKGFYYRTL